MKIQTANIQDNLLSILSVTTYLFSSFSAIEQINTYYKTCEVNDYGYCIDKCSIEFNSGNFKQQKMYVRIMHIRVTHLVPDLPVPVGTKAITPSPPGADYKPGKTS